MRYNEEIEGLLNKIGSLVSKEYEESVDKFTKEYESEIARLNAVIDAWKDICNVAQNENEKLKETNEKLSDRLKWKNDTGTVYQVK